MKKNKITQTEIDALAAWIEKHAEHIHLIDRPEDSKPPAVRVIHCVLSLNRNYHSFVLPRLEDFAAKHLETRTVHELADLIASFPTPHTFMQQELNYNYEELAYTLQSVVEFVCKIVENEPKVSEEVALKNWAIQAKPEEYQTLNIRRFGIAGFQYLRMLLRADTVKPDVHVRRYVSKIIDRNVSDNELILLLEASSKQANHSVRAVDRYIWDLGAKKVCRTVRCWYEYNKT